MSEYGHEMCNETADDLREEIEGLSARLNEACELLSSARTFEHYSRDAADLAIAIRAFFKRTSEMDYQRMWCNKPTAVEAPESPAP